MTFALNTSGVIQDHANPSDDGKVHLRENG